MTVLKLWGSVEMHVGQKLIAIAGSTAAKKWGRFSLIMKQLSNLRWYSSRHHNFIWDESFPLENQHSGTPCEYFPLWKKIIVLNAKVLHPYQMHGPLEQVFFVLMSSLLVGGAIEKHINHLFLRNVCFPRANISVAVSSSDSLKSMKFLCLC